MWFMGVDPGLNGAMAFLRLHGGISELLIHDFSIKPQGTSAARRREIDIVGTAKIIENFLLLNGPVQLAVVETPHSMPNDGHVGAFKFGKTCGLLEGMIQTLGINMVGTMPAVWKVRMGLTSKKEDSLSMARTTFPNHKHYFERKKDNDRAEAALLAWYGWKTFGGL